MPHISPDWVTAVCAVLLLLGGFITWMISFFASKDQMGRMEKAINQIQQDHEVLFSNQENDRQERTKVAKLLQDVDQLFRTLQSSEKFTNSNQVQLKVHEGS